MSRNPAVTLSTAYHWHGVPETKTNTMRPGSVRFESFYPLHVGDYWASHYVPEWEDSHDTFVRSGVASVICDGSQLPTTEISYIDCGRIFRSPVISTIIRP